MTPSALRQRLLGALSDFAWEQWGQMGVLAAVADASPWAQDPEALLLLTLEVAREDPRLFDEVLDWLARNEPIVSSRRLRTLCEGPEDERLVGAALQWVALQRRPRSPAARMDAKAADDPEPLFRAPSLPVRDPDPSFLQHGFARPVLRPSGKSSGPDLTEPINFAFRLRHLLGVGARAEAVRFLLTVDAPRATVAAVTASAGYAKRNVHEALHSLHAAGAVSLVTVGADQRFGIDRERWAAVLGTEADLLPVHREWLQLFGALRRLLRWLARPDLEGLSDYLRASQARDVLDDVRPRLARAGVITAAARGREGAWDDLAETVEYAVLALGPGAAGPRGTGFEVYTDARGQFRWRLRAANGRIYATSAEAFATRPAAERAADRVRATAGSPTSLIEPDAAGNFRWLLRASNGRTVATSGESFATHAAAERAAYAAAASLAHSAAEPDENARKADRSRRHVLKRPDGRWVDKAEGASRAASVHPTQAEAVEAARNVARNVPGGAQVIVHAADGRIRETNVVADDPMAPKDSER